MEKYEQISVIGEGSYGIVLKCRHLETNQLVAVKKFLETDEDETIRKITLREIGILRRLKHANLVTLIEVLRHKKRFYLVFEYLERTVLDELDRMPSGLGLGKCKEIIFQVLRAIRYCHKNHVIHRDVKPENVLVSSRGVVKLCDFGFARRVNMSSESCTGYVATRWYRAPELLLGERNYGAAVDIWAIGCLFAEIMTGDPIFPGESDIDQIYLIVKLLGKPCLRDQKRLAKSTQFKHLVDTPVNTVNLDNMLSSWPPHAVDFFKSCLKMNPQQRPSADDLLKHEYFLEDNFSQKFLKDLRQKVEIEFNNPLLKKYKTEVLIDSDEEDDVKSSALPNCVKGSFILSKKNVKRKLNCTNLHEGCLVSKKSDSYLSIPKEFRNLIENEEYYGMDFSMARINNSLESTENNKSDENPSQHQSINSTLDSDESYNSALCGNEGRENFDLSNNRESTYQVERNKMSCLINGCNKNCNQESTLVCEKIKSVQKEQRTTYSNSLLNVNTNEIMPIDRYKKGKRKRNTLDISLPIVVVEKI